jgi:hypothetical protein
MWLALEGGRQGQNKARLAIALGAAAAVGAAVAAMAIWLTHMATGHVGLAAVLAAAGFAGFVLVVFRISSNKAIALARKASQHQREKYEAYYHLLASWMRLRISGRTLAEYFADHQFKTVAIYGLGRLGVCLREELRQSGVDVRYGIDLRAQHFSYLDIKVVSPDSPMEPVDVVVVTPFFEAGKLIEDLQGRSPSRIITLRDIVYSL